MLWAWPEIGPCLLQMEEKRHAKQAHEQQERQTAVREEADRLAKDQA